MKTKYVMYLSSRLTINPDFKTQLIQSFWNSLTLTFFPDRDPQNSLPWPYFQDFSFFFKFPDLSEKDLPWHFLNISTTCKIDPSKTLYAVLICTCFSFSFKWSVLFFFLASIADLLTKFLCIYKNNCEN